MNPDFSSLPRFLIRDGEMRKQIREHDWENNPLGHPAEWPACILNSVQLCLDSLFPILIWIGPEFRMIYNDAYKPALGSTKIPDATGRPGIEIWPEIWDTIGPSLESIYATGEAVLENNQLLLLNRHGYLEETYWTYCYSPIKDEYGAVKGIFSAIKETTKEVITDRQLRMLRDMGNQVVEVKSIDEVYEKCLRIIKSNNYDFPFTLFYRLRLDGSGADLFGSTGIDLNVQDIPRYMNFADGQIGSRNFLKCVRTNKPVLVHDLQDRLGKLPGGYWKSSPEEAILLPVTLPGAEKPKVVIVAGVNPHIKLTPEYAAFYELVADQVTTEIVKIKSFEEARMQAVRIAEIHQSNERNFRLMANSIPQMIWVTDGEGKAFFYNDQWTSYTGLNAEELNGSGWQASLHPDDLVSFHTKWQRAHESKTVFETEYRLRGVDGIYRWFLARAVPVIEQDEITRWYGTTTNIDEKRKLEEKIKESENILRKLVNHSPSAIVILSANNYIIELANKKYLDFMGVAPEDVIGKSAIDLFPALRERGLDKIMENTIRTGEPYFHSELEVDMKRYGGEGVVYFTFLYQPLQNAEGVFDKIMVVSTDITTHVQLRKNIEVSETKFKVLSESVPQLVWTADNNGDIKYYNNRFREYARFRDDGDKPYEWEAVIHPDDYEATMQEWKRSVEGGIFYQKEHRLKMADGTYQWHLSRAYPETAGEGRGNLWYGTATNIHELKISEERIKESNSRLRLALESTHMGTWDYNPLTDELELSERTREIFGFEPGEKVDMMMLYDTITIKDRANVISSIQYALMLDSDGNLNLEFSIDRKRHINEKVLKVNGKTFFDDKGNAYRFVGTVLDITEQKKFSEELEARITQRTQELKIANDELMQINSKLEKSNKELESFTYVASHDLQEPLRKILFFSDLIRQNSDNQLDGLEKYFNKIMVSTRRMSDLITSLLQYSTISHSSESFTDVNLDTVLQNVKEDYEILIVEKQAIIMSEPLPMVKGNKVQLFQLMANLLSNALKFSRHAPMILIQYRLKKIQDLGNMHLSPYTAFHEITIRDNGIGFEQEYSDQIFVIFQRLHHQNDFPGMGLGLALCKKIVDSHHGHIKVSSTPGEGSEFTIYLPAFT